MIFVGIVLLTLSILNASSNKSEFESVLMESDHISSILISPGVPNNWNSSMVKALGLTSNNRINTSKLLEFDAINYYALKSLLGVNDEFAFYFENVSGILNVEGTCLRGFVSGCDDLYSVIEYDDLSSTSRVVILNSSIVELVVVVWR